MRILPFFNHIIQSCYTSFLSDEEYAKYRYKVTFGKELNLARPETFNEKIQWLKLFNRDNKYSKLADKYEVRKYVEETVGSKILNELYGVFLDVDEINFDKLPDSFVLKATHGSGWNIICKDKSSLNWMYEKKKLNKWLKTNYYDIGREWCYKNIHSKIICEKYLEPITGNQLNDYKFFCFNGVVEIIQVDVDRYTHHTRCFYDKDWNKQPFTLCYPLYKDQLPSPNNLCDMIAIAEKLASDIPFLRVDLYSLGSKLTIFGELTFYPENGFEVFYPTGYDKTLGSFLQLPNQ